LTSQKVGRPPLAGAGQVARRQQQANFPVPRTNKSHFPKYDRGMLLNLDKNREIPRTPEKTA